MFGACENGGGERSSPKAKAGADFGADGFGTGTEWYIVEQEDGAMPMLECVAKDRENLKKMGK